MTDYLVPTRCLHKILQKQHHFRIKKIEKSGFFICSRYLVEIRFIDLFHLIDFVLLNLSLSDLQILFIFRQISLILKCLENGSFTVFLVFASEVKKVGILIKFFK